MQEGCQRADSRSLHVGDRPAEAPCKRKRRAVGLIPAAGRSRRFGGDKLSALVGGTPLIVRVTGAFIHAALVRDVFVVTRPDRTDLLRLLEPRGVRVLLLSEPTPDMRATVEQGIRELEALGELADCDALLVTPADVLGITPGLLDTLVRESIGDLDAVCVPVTAGRRAHPLLLPWSARGAVRSLPPGKGLNALLTGEVVRVREIPVEEARQVDVDTRQDLDRLEDGGSV